MNRDKKGHPIFDCLTKARNYLPTLLKLKKKEAKEAQLPINTSTSAEKRKYLLYCISCLEGEKYRNARTLLALRANGATILGLAHHFKVPVKMLRTLESDAIKRVEDAIIQKKKHGTPILGGLN